MKKTYIIVVAFFLTAINIQAQSFRFEVSAVSLSVKNGGKWSDFTPFKEAKIVATFNPEKNTIGVYSEIPQYFKIKKYYDRKSEDGKDIDGFDCMDNNGEFCFIEIHSRQKENLHQLYITYSDRMMVYNMKYKK
ncbi:MAG: hypothetical protein KBC56_05490 [Flavobacterium sp.]|nr:hypothetical protein [Flavobacterium sp.]